MGSWNQSCALTGLPIIDGEKVYGLFLGIQATEEHYDNMNYCYPSYMWQPMGWMFTGEYNDYGAMEDCGGMFKETLKCIQNSLVEQALGENKYHDIEVTKAKMVDEKYLFEADHEGRLFVKTYRRFKLKHVQFRKDVVDSLMKIYKKECYDYERPHKQGDKGTYIDLQALIKKKFKEHEAKVKSGDEVYKMLMMMRADEWWPLKSNSGIFGLGNFYEMQEDYIKTFETNDDVTRKAMQKNMLMQSVIGNLLYDARSLWHVPSGAGSQNDETTGQELIAKLTLQGAEFIKKDREERYKGW